LAARAVGKGLACSQSVLELEQRLVAANVVNYYTPVTAADGDDIRRHGTRDAPYARLHGRELVDDFA